MKPVELSGQLVAIEPLSVEDSAGLLAAADAEEVTSRWSESPFAPTSGLAAAQAR